MAASIPFLSYADVQPAKPDYRSQGVADLMKGVQAVFASKYKEDQDKKQQEIDLLNKEYEEYLPGKMADTQYKKALAEKAIEDALLAKAKAPSEIELSQATAKKTGAEANEIINGSWIQRLTGQSQKQKLEAEAANLKEETRLQGAKIRASAFPFFAQSAWQTGNPYGPFVKESLDAIMTGKAPPMPHPSTKKKPVSIDDEPIYGEESPKENQAPSGGGIFNLMNQKILPEQGSEIPYRPGMEPSGLSGLARNPSGNEDVPRPKQEPGKEVQLSEAQTTAVSAYPGMIKSVKELRDIYRRRLRGKGQAEGAAIGLLLKANKFDKDLSRVNALRAKLILMRSNVGQEKNKGAVSEYDAKRLDQLLGTVFDSGANFKSVDGLLTDTIADWRVGSAETKNNFDNTGVPYKGYNEFINSGITERDKRKVQNILKNTDSPKWKGMSLKERADAKGMTLERFIVEILKLNGEL